MGNSLSELIQLAAREWEASAKGPFNPQDADVLRRVSLVLRSFQTIQQLERYFGVVEEKAEPHVVLCRCVSGNHR